MKLAGAIEIVLDVARHRLTSEHTSDDVMEASGVVEDFFANHVRLVEGAQYALHFALNEAEDDEKTLEMANAALDFLNDYLKKEGAE